MKLYDWELNKKILGLPFETSLVVREDHHKEGPLVIVQLNDCRVGAYATAIDANKAAKLVHNVLNVVINEVKK